MMLSGGWKVSDRVGVDLRGGGYTRTRKQIRIRV